MSLVPWRPFRDLDEVFNEDDWFLPLVSAKEKTRDVAVNLYETEKDLIAEVGVPGIDPEKIDVNIKGDVLEIKGEEEKTKEDSKKNYWKKEISKSSFRRGIKLPVSVNEKKVDATYESGILKVTMPKKKELKEGKTKIKVKKK